MRKQSIDNIRYPHFVKIIRKEFGGWLSGEEKTETVLYSGRGRCCTNGGVSGQQVDSSHRFIFIPVRFDEWGTETKPSDGDTVEVAIGAIAETMTLKDFESDNNRTVLYCERNGNADL